MCKVGGIIAGIGLAMLLVSLSADMIGLGSGPGFGNVQITGIVVGGVVAIVGSLVTIKGKRHED